jgi:hypothetical protein
MLTLPPRPTPYNSIRRVFSNFHTLYHFVDTKFRRNSPVPKQLRTLGQNHGGEGGIIC